MPDRDAFIRTILDSPDDDGPRLVYADWLEECGETDRAEFIRVQCELAKLLGSRLYITPDDDGDRGMLYALEGSWQVWVRGDVEAKVGDRVNVTKNRDGREPVDFLNIRVSEIEVRAGSSNNSTILVVTEDSESSKSRRPGQLRRRERELLELHIGEWTDGLPESLVARECPACAEGGIADPETNVIECGRCDSTGLIADCDSIEFRRGFIEDVNCDWPTWSAHADAILAAHPVRTVRLTTEPVIAFGPIQNFTSRDDKQRTTTFTATWEVVVGWQSTRHGHEATFSDEDMAADPLYRQRFDREAMEGRTLRGYCRITWPRVKTWHLPPPPVATTPTVHMAQANGVRLDVESFDAGDFGRAITIRQLMVRRNEGRPVDIRYVNDGTPMLIMQLPGDDVIPSLPHPLIMRAGQRLQLGYAGDAEPFFDAEWDGERLHVADPAASIRTAGPSHVVH